MRTDLRLTLWIGLAACLLANPATSVIAAAASATLHWTAPGDDGYTGRATAYDVRYSLALINAANFSLATAVAGVPAPGTAGSAESFSITNLVSGSGYYFAIKTRDEAANWSAMSNVVYATASTTSIDPSGSLSFSLPYPNPARGDARWSYSLPAAGQLAIDAFDLAGRHVASIASGWKSAGQGSAVWDLRDESGVVVAPGVYLVRTVFGSYRSTKRLVVTR
jgi:hypothetical protein